MSTQDKCPRCNSPLRGSYFECGTVNHDMAERTDLCKEMAISNALKVSPDLSLSATDPVIALIRDACYADWEDCARALFAANNEVRKKLEEVEIKEIAGGYAAQVLRRHVGLDNTKEDLCEVAELVDALKARVRELEKAKSDAARWCPDRCPITFRPFFMWIEHPEKGYVPTYGGPYDSYTIPEPEMPEDGKKTEFHDIDFFIERYDHDEGCWVDGCADPGMRVILTDNLIEMHEVETLKARVRELEGLPCGARAYESGLVVDFVGIPLSRFIRADTTLGEAMLRKEEK